MRALAPTALALALAACRGAGTHEPDPSESPQAQAVPAPLASAAGVASALVVEAGPPPEALRGDRPMEVDTVARDAAVWELRGAFVHASVAPAAHAPEVSAQGIEAARRKTDTRLAVELGASRMRMVQVSRGFVLPADAEIRARVDRFGHVAVWQASSYYRPLAPGALRALLGERRFDVGPLSPVTTERASLDGEELGLRRTHRVTIESRVARARFDLARAPEVGDAAQLLCRALLDLMNAPPSSVVCAPDELPLHAEWAWADGGSLRFDAQGWARKLSPSSGALAAPPEGARFGAGPMLTTGVAPFLSSGELDALRAGAAPSASGEPDGVLVVNATEQLRTLWIDGVPLLWAAPGARERVVGLQPGRYVAQWRTFLGDDVGPTFSLAVPGTAAVGEVPDGGL